MAVAAWMASRLRFDIGNNAACGVALLLVVDDRERRLCAVPRMLHSNGGRHAPVGTCRACREAACWLVFESSAPNFAAWKRAWHSRPHHHQRVGAWSSATWHQAATAWKARAAALDISPFLHLLFCRHAKAGAQRKGLAWVDALCWGLCQPATQS